MIIRLLNTNVNRKRLFLVLIAFVVFIIFYFTYFDQSPVCYFDQEWKDKKTLPGVGENLRLRSHDEPKNIFFHETSCSKDGVIRLTTRQACAVESAGEAVNSYYGCYQFLSF